MVECRPEILESDVKDMSLPEKIKELRNHKNMTQELLAERMGVSRQAVTKWENGQSRPSTQNLLTLAELFGVSVTELLGEKNTYKPKRQRMFLVFAAFSTVLLIFCGWTILKLLSFPSDVIGYADMPTDIYVNANVTDFLPLYFFTAAMVGITIWLYLRKGKKRGTRK